MRIKYENDFDNHIIYTIWDVYMTLTVKQMLALGLFYYFASEERFGGPYLNSFGFFSGYIFVLTSLAF